MDILKILSIRFYLNFLGGIIRYVFGTIWRTIFNKPKFTFKEYIYGPKSDNYYDEMGHSFNNRMIALVFLVILVMCLINFYPEK
jgi:membrane protein YqaA with SNARE-associated domain